MAKVKQPGAATHGHGNSHQWVVAEIRRRILRGTLGPGQAVNQEELASDLRVSRMPVREALRTLEVEGLVQLSPNRGAVVNALSRAEVQELYLLRQILEQAAVRRAAERITPEQVASLDELLVRMEAHADAPPDDWQELHTTFHLQLYAAAGLPRMSRIVANLRNIVEPYSRIYVQLPDRYAQARREHREILAACGANDADSAERVLATHLMSPSQALLNVLPQ